MVKLTDSQIAQEIGNIVSQFQLYQCAVANRQRNWDRPGRVDAEFSRWK